MKSLHQLSKEKNSCPWLNNLYEFAKIVKEDYVEDIEEPYKSGNFTTMICHKDLLRKKNDKVPGRLFRLGPGT